MARKATSKTPNKELVRDILDDQSSLFIQHLSRSDKRKDRLHHNLVELYYRLGETVGDCEILFFE